MSIGTLLQPVACTWAGRPASAPNGFVIYASDVGEYGTCFQYAGGRWRVLNGSGMLKALGAVTAAVGAAETIILQTLLPAGAWQINDTVRIGVTMTKSGTTDTGLVTLRVGTAGTTADTAITGISALAVIAASGQSGGFWFDIKLVSATSAHKLGAAGGSTGSYNLASSSSVASVATTITDASANALYVSFAINSGGATNTVVAQSASIQLITP